MSVTIESGFKVALSAVLAVVLTLVVAGSLDAAANTSMTGVSYSQMAQNAASGVDHLVG